MDSLPTHSQSVKVRSTTFKWQVGDDIRRLASRDFKFDSVVAMAQEGHAELRHPDRIVQITLVASDISNLPTYVAEDESSLQSSIDALEKKGSRSIKLLVKLGDKDKDEAEWDVVGDAYDSQDDDIEVVQIPVHVPITGPVAVELSESASTDTEAKHDNVNAEVRFSFAVVHAPCTYSPASSSLTILCVLLFLQSAFPQTILENSVHPTHPNWLSSASAGAMEEKASVVAETKYRCSHWYVLSDLFFVYCRSSRSGSSKTLIENGHYASFPVCSNKPIFGIRYKCLYCTAPAFHLCPECDSDLETLVLRCVQSSHTEKRSSSPDRDVDTQSTLQEERQPFHDVNHPFIRVLHPHQCPDSGVVAKSLRRARANPYGISVLSTVGISAGSSVALQERFFAGWKVRNDSDQEWVGWRLRFTRGFDLRVDKTHDFCLPERLGPGMVADVLMEMEAPAVNHSRCRNVCGCFRFALPTGTLVGPPLEYDVVIPSSAAVGAGAAKTTRTAAVGAGAAKTTRTSRGGHNDRDRCRSRGDKPAVGAAKGRGAEPCDVADSEAFPPLGACIGQGQPVAESKGSGPTVTYRAELKQLGYMGFKNVDRNILLLKEGRSVPQIVEHLLTEPNDE